ncbi:hypothetical protein HOR18_gp106 [Staphylococcus phage vB_SscM-1]|uniref:Uncharacterized protein n=2 Tax=Sciuriunavirus SscM1 TaxID=2734053 RepID=A0A1X9I9Y7_9CAUD|nr:hypothetical protein HOR18_gp106 [Staphylococcus phage vB_SscM-1]ANT44769.1 hypothetical protein vB_SscM-1_105 [Staphylococcus phage vB_SscM-1]ANT44971.1 hypothetical protein vB_SscM-2_104 [Staphylococcus phage vB_SscM-2]
MRMTEHVRYTMDCFMQLGVTFEVTPEAIIVVATDEDVYSIQFKDGIAEVAYRYYGKLKRLGVLQHLTNYTLEETPQMCEEIKEHIQ